MSRLVSEGRLSRAKDKPRARNAHSAPLTLETPKIGLALYQTPAELQTKIDLYFKEEVGHFPLLDKEGKQICNGITGTPLMEVKPPTVAGMAYFLGFAERKSLYDYKVDPRFSITVKKAILRIERYAEINLQTNQKPIGSIFWLKNHGWKDRLEVEHDLADELLEKWRELSADQLLERSRLLARQVLGTSGTATRN